MNRSGILAIDQGTTSSRAIVFDTDGREVAIARQNFFQHYPASGWVEHDPAEIWGSSLEVCREALAGAEQAGVEVVAIGITNQRETTLLWDRETGEPLHSAIVWQDRRTADQCERLRKARKHERVQACTGLLLDPYFSATKLAWLLDHVDDARARARAGRLAFGTVDTWLLWNLTGGAEHATDATNASRTMLFDIHEQDWSEEMLELFNIPRSVLPEVRDSAADFGNTLAALFGRSLPIRGIAGDQHAAMVGQGCFDTGSVKSTYGTGCFALMNTGADAVASSNRLLTTLAYRLDGRPVYALEGSIFVAGAAVQWLRDELGVIEQPAETEALAAGMEGNAGVYLVPAFTGLGAPYWDPHARGAIFGLTRDTGVAAFARAALESVCYQSHDLITAMSADAGGNPRELRVDGGMTVNDWFLQYLADIVAVDVLRPAVTETTALGAAYLAGLGCGIWPDIDAVRRHWQLERRFSPSMGKDQRDTVLAGWADAVGRVTCS